MPMTIAVPLALIRARLLMSGAILHVGAVGNTTCHKTVLRLALERIRLTAV